MDNRKVDYENKENLGHGIKGDISTAASPLKNDKTSEDCQAANKKSNASRRD